MPPCLPTAMPFRALAPLLISLTLMAQEAQPLPDPTVLLERVILATKGLESVRASYTYLRESTERKLDGQGRVKETSRKTHEVTRIGTGQVQRLVAEDGIPLSAAKAEAEAVAVESRLKALLEPKEEPATKKEKGFQVSLSDMLAVLEVAHLERTVQDGRTLLAVDLRPKKQAKIHGLGQRFASKLVGRLLVDEASSQVVVAEGRMQESCWIGGGLLGSVAPPTTFKVQQSQVGPGVWMPTTGEFAVHARVAVVPVHMEISFRCWDFKRFVVEDTVVAPPASAETAPPPGG